MWGTDVAAAARSCSAHAWTADGRSVAPCGRASSRPRPRTTRRALYVAAAAHLIGRAARAQRRAAVEGARRRRARAGDVAGSAQHLSAGRDRGALGDDRGRSLQDSWSQTVSIGAPEQSGVRPGRERRWLDRSRRSARSSLCHGAAGSPPRWRCRAAEAWYLRSVVAVTRRGCSPIGNGALLLCAACCVNAPHVLRCPSCCARPCSKIMRATQDPAASLQIPLSYTWDNRATVQYTDIKSTTHRRRGANAHYQRQGRAGGRAAAEGWGVGGRPPCSGRRWRAAARPAACLLAQQTQRWQGQGATGARLQSRPRAFRWLFEWEGWGWERERETAREQEMYRHVKMSH